MRGTDNLLLYIREAILPPLRFTTNTPALPPPGHKSHANNLHIRPEVWRRFDRILMLRPDVLDVELCFWIKNNISSSPIGSRIRDKDWTTGEQLTVPALPHFDIPRLDGLKPPSNISTFIPWVDTLPLETVQRIMHLSYPETAHWSFEQGEDIDVDSAAFRHFCWKNRLNGETPLVVALQPPWILSDKDLKEFSECQTMLPATLPGYLYPPVLESRHRLWGKMWDLCAARKATWFVLTSYTGWVLGRFSKGRTTAFVTSVFNFDLQTPTVLECLVYWISLATGLIDVPSSMIVEVPEPVKSFQPFTPPAYNSAEPFRSDVSESNWSGKHDEIGSSAGVSLASFQGSFSAPPSPRPRRDYKLPEIAQWMQTIPEGEDAEMPPLADLDEDEKAQEAIPILINHSKGGVWLGDWLAM